MSLIESNKLRHLLNKLHSELGYVKLSQVKDCIKQLEAEVSKDKCEDFDKEEN